MTVHRAAPAVVRAIKLIQIAIEREADTKPDFLIHLIAQCWREGGHTVEFVDYRRVDGEANLVIPHFNRTYLPDALLARAPPERTLNFRVRDISKSHVSAQIVTPGDDWHGPVIVKSNRNSFAAPDHVRGLVPRFAGARLRRLLPWRIGRVLPRRNYPVLPHASAVPAWVWRNSEYVVEHFRPERRSDLYVTRNWVFLGSRDHNQATFGRHPVVKTGSVVRVEPCEPPPREVRDLRARLGVDYGKIDWAIADDGPAVYDVNPTPTVGARTERHYAIARHLAAGIG